MFKNIIDTKITYGDILQCVIGVLAVGIAIIPIITLKHDVHQITTDTGSIKTELKQLLGKPTTTFRLMKGEIYFFDNDKSSLMVVDINHAVMNVLVKFSIRGGITDQIMGLQQQRTFTVSDEEQYIFTLYDMQKTDTPVVAFVVTKQFTGGKR